MMRKFYFLVGVILCSTSIFANSEISEIEELIRQSHESLSNKNWIEAYAIADESYLLSKSTDYAWGMANSQFIKGWSKFKENQLSEALLLYLESLRILQERFEDNEKLQLKASLHMNVGQIYRLYSNYEGALNFYEQGLEFARNNDDQERIIKFTYNIGVVHKYAGSLAEAAKYFVESKYLSLNQKSDKWYFNSINQLGLINKDLERYDSARFYFDQAFPVTDRLQNKSKYRAMIYHNKANSYFLEGDFYNAQIFFTKSLEEKPKFISYKDLSEMLLAQGDYEAAYNAAVAATELYDAEKVTTENASIFQILGSACFASGRNDEGRLYMDRFTTEINKYLETREYTKKLEDAYQIDLLTKQYFLKLEQQKRQAQIIQLSWFFGIVVFAFILLFFAQRWYQKRKKADATDAIKAIFNQSEILRGSLDREL